MDISIKHSFMLYGLPQEHCGLPKISALLKDLRLLSHVHLKSFILDRGKMQYKVMRLNSIIYVKIKCDANNFMLPKI